MKKDGKGALGKGIGALLGNMDFEPDIIHESAETVRMIAVTDINPNEQQPRKNFDDDKLNELAQSIKENGIIQPLIVTTIENNQYQLVAGERRWRAARIAGLEEVPVIIREMSEDKILEHALIENIQREDLNPIEEASALKELIDKYVLTQTELAERVGKSRAAIANTMRLLNLPERIRDEIAAGELTEGHGRALLGLQEDAKMLLAMEQVLAQDMSVRETEALVQRLLAQPEGKARESEREETQKNPLRALTLRRVEQVLRDQLGTKVKVKDKHGKGMIQLYYQSNEDLERILAILDLDQKI